MSGLNLASLLVAVFIAVRDLRREYPYAVESFMRTDHATMTPGERDFVERTLDRREDG